VLLFLSVCVPVCLSQISDQQGKKLDLETTYSGDNWIGQVLFGRPDNSIGCTYVQSITPNLSLGGE
jgi:hypothetical protein